jgi:hypothetical protein
VFLVGKSRKPGVSLGGSYTRRNIAMTERNCRRGESASIIDQSGGINRWMSGKQDAALLSLRFRDDRKVFKLVR